MSSKVLALVCVAALVAATATVGMVVLSGAKPATPNAQEPQVNTAKVERGTLSAMVSLFGILHYGALADGSPYSMSSQTPGTLTGLSAVGQVVEQGEVLYRMDGNPVVLLYGTTPAYRSLSAGLVGADVRQLNMNLVALGYATSAELPEGTDTFTPATITALKKLQARLGVFPTGRLLRGQAVFQPHAVRVTAAPVPLGSALQAGTLVLQGTSTTRVVTIALDTAKQSEVKVGDSVIVTLPDNSSTPGSVTWVSAVATTTSSDRGGGAPTITVEVQPTDPAATGSLDQAPVQVEITTKVVENALSVPVTALVGKSGGGFAVEVVRADGRRALVPVKVGLFDSGGGRVQVEGELSEDDSVVVPSL